MNHLINIFFFKAYEMVYEFFQNSLGILLLRIKGLNVVMFCTSLKRPTWVSSAEGSQWCLDQSESGSSAPPAGAQRTPAVGILEYFAIIFCHSVSFRVNKTTINIPECILRREWARSVALVSFVCSSPSPWRAVGSSGWGRRWRR